MNFVSFSHMAVKPFQTFNSGTFTRHLRFKDEGILEEICEVRRKKVI